MPATQSVLNYDVFTAPEKPYVAPPPTVGDAPAWDPTRSTLIFGARDAVLVDPLMTVPEATALADWVGLHDRNLTTIYITHPHGDHYLGLPLPFSTASRTRGPVAAPGTVRHMNRAAGRSNAGHLCSGRSSLVRSLRPSLCPSRSNRRESSLRAPPSR